MRHKYRKKKLFVLMNVGKDTNLSDLDLLDVSQLYCPCFAIIQSFNHKISAWMDNGSPRTKQQYEGITKNLQSPTQTLWEATNL